MKQTYQHIHRRGAEQGDRGFSSSFPAMGLCLCAALAAFSAPARAADADADAAAGTAIEPRPVLPPGFVRLDEAIPDILLDPRYAGADNFAGAPLPGYLAPTVVLSRTAASALARAADEIRPHGFVFLVYDGYRPRKAVEYLLRWATLPDDPLRKARFYPRIRAKADLFRLGYLAERSGHSRGSTVDLTIARAATGEPLDMGGPFDFLDPSSAHDAPGLSETAAGNRRGLRALMERHGFRAYTREWWHYTLRDEPFPDHHFDFPVH